MKILNTSVMIVCMALFLFVAPSHAAKEKKPWTFIAYIAAANSLSDFSFLDIDEMKKVGSNTNINVLVYLTVQQPGKKKVTTRYYIEKGKATKIGTDVPMDSGARATLLNAMTWAVNDYPSDHLAVVLWNHGSGPLNRKPTWLQELRGICYDDATGSFFTDLDCKYVFDTIRNLRKGSSIDIIACDACLMANIEIAYALQNSADFLVASQETIPGEGFDYAGCLAKFQQGSLAAEVFARAMLDAYHNAYEGQKDWTLSLIDLHKMPALTATTNQVANLLSAYLAADTTKKLKSIIAAAASSRVCQHFTEDTYIDLYSFYRNLLQKVPTMPISSANKTTLSAALAAAQRACNEAVLDAVTSADLKNARGLSVYFPNTWEGIHKSYPAVYWSQTTSWLKFLKAYLK